MTRGSPLTRGCQSALAGLGSRRLGDLGDASWVEDGHGDHLIEDPTLPEGLHVVVLLDI